MIDTAAVKAKHVDRGDGLCRHCSMFRSHPLVQLANCDTHKLALEVERLREDLRKATAKADGYREAAVEAEKRAEAAEKRVANLAAEIETTRIGLCLSLGDERPCTESLWDHYRCMARRLDATEERAAKAENAVVAHGEWICDKCGFVCSLRVMEASTGRVGIDTKVPTEPCPNDGAEMRLLTWRELSQRNYDGAIALVERLATTRETCAAAAEILEAAAAEFRSQILEGVAGDLREMAKP